MTTPYDTCKIVKALRVAFADYNEVDDLVEIVGDANNKAYKTIFKNLVKYFDNEDNEIDEDLVALWETLKTDNPKKSKDSDDESEEKVKTKSPKKSKDSDDESEEKVKTKSSKAKSSEEKVKTKSPKKSKDSDDESEEKVKTKSSKAKSSEEKVKTKSPKKSKNAEKTFELDADIDSSEFPDIEFIEQFDKRDFIKIFGEDNLKETDFEDDTYNEWTFNFEDKEFSIYCSDLDDDMTWILAGNTKTKKIVKELYEVMKIKLE